MAEVANTALSTRLTTDLSGEITRATAAEVANTALISDVSSNLSTEVTRATAAEVANTVLINDVSSNLSSANTDKANRSGDTFTGGVAISVITNSTSKLTGALVTSGGVGIGLDTNIGGSLSVCRCKFIEFSLLQVALLM